MTSTRPFRIPTKDEIERAAQDMVPDLTAGTADKMGRLASNHPGLQAIIREMMRTAATSVEARSMTPVMAMESVIGSAIAYGIHMGVYIGMAREKRKIQ